jgi:NAD(P)-dependent dehydrogenase (short-subunit alcohol dehydrogenase family)
MPSQPANENPPKVALVTGAARRIGKSIALRLAESGWHVAIHYRKSAAKAEAVAAEVRLRGGKAMTVEADLMHEDQVESVIPKVAEHLGALSLLVNNASTFEMDKAETATRASWDKHIEANLRAPLVLSQAFARQFTRESGGNIINMLDQRVWKLTPYFISYTVAKMGLWTLTRTLALSYAPRIRVNGIGPGPTLPSPRQSDEQFAQQSAAMPLGHGATPREIAKAVLFILESPSMTGQMIALDGGEHLGWQVPGKGYQTRE